MAENLPIMAENPQGYSLMLYSFPRKDLISSVIIFILFIYSLTLHVLLLVTLCLRYCHFSLSPFAKVILFSVSWLLCCQLSRCFMEIGFLLAIMSLIPTVDFDPEDKGLIPSILSDGAWPGYSKFFYLYSSATFCCVAILKFVCFDCSYINLYSVATVFF